MDFGEFFGDGIAAGANSRGRLKTALVVVCVLLIGGTASYIGFLVSGISGAFVWGAVGAFLGGLVGLFLRGIFFAILIGVFVAALTFVYSMYVSPS